MRSTICLWILLSAAPLAVAEELTLENVTQPEPNRAEEPRAESFSLDAATRFLDQASLDWTKRRKCFTCHTNYSYLMARPAISANHAAHRSIRAALEELVEKRWVEQGPRWDAEVVMSAATLALNDRATTGKLHPATRQALDRMWSVQRADGGFDWLKCGWPPMESDDEYGAAMALLAAFAAPEDYASSAAARNGLDKLRDYLTHHPPPTLHHTALLLWADSFGAEALGEDRKQAASEQLLALQRPDGGWAVATLGNWERGDGKPQDTRTSDGYGTGFVVYVLRRAGIAADHPSLRRGIDWLKANQRASGRWYTRSLNKDNHHFLSHAGSAFALLALAACD